MDGGVEHGGPAEVRWLCPDALSDPVFVIDPFLRAANTIGDTSVDTWLVVGKS